MYSSVVNCALFLSSSNRRKSVSMKKQLHDSISGKCMISAALLALMMPALATAQNSSPYRVTGGTGTVHIYPTPELSRQIKAQQGLAPGVLSYHGGPVMTGVNLYAIFWIPATLQNGNATSLSAKYQSVAKNFLTDYPDHGIANNSTQYYSTTSGTKYFVGKGGFAASYVDTNPYPTSACTDTDTPGNCITDAQLQTEISRVMTLKSWTPALNKMFLVFTSTGEGSCFDSTSASCAYTQYCAYHGWFGNSTTPTIYANQPYADPTFCYSPGTGQKAPSGDQPSDANVNVTSHEITEANTDPELNAWWDTGNGEEIGDLCAWSFGTNGWDAGLANQMWNGRFYDLQLEYDNHTSSCVQVGP
jgi:hypothetical protein